MVPRNAQYWIDRLAPRAEVTIDLALEHLANLHILEHHEGDFWPISQTVRQGDLNISNGQGTAVQFAAPSIRTVLFRKEITSPRDLVIVCLLNTCDVLCFIFLLDDESDKRFKVNSQLELLDHAIAATVAHDLAGPLLRRHALTKPIPTVLLRRLLLNPYFCDGNLPAMYAGAGEQYGPVFEIRPLLSKTPLIFLASPKTNYWAHREGRMHLRARDYLQDFKKVYGASGILATLDGTDHFRFPKALQPA